MNSFSLTNDKNNFNKMGYSMTGKEDKYSTEKFNDVLSQYKASGVDKYYHYLTEPEICVNAKIPSSYPVPTSSIKIHSTYIMTTNVLGNFVFAGNPFFLGNTYGNSSFMASNAATIDGITPTNLMAVNMGLTQPADIYASYRLVSASLVCSPRLSPLNMSGTLSGGIFLDSTFDVAAIGSVVGNTGNFSIFSNIDNSLFNQCALSKDGLRLLYFPTDPVLESFNATGYARKEFIFSLYGQGLPASSNCVRIDYYGNYECTVYPNYVTWIPRSLSYSLTSTQKEEAFRRIQGHLGKQKFVDQTLEAFIEDAMNKECEEKKEDLSLSIISKK